MSSFTNFGFSAVLLNTVKNMGFIKPTPVQERAIPLVLEGKDVIASAQTGSGKTCAFALPLVEILDKRPEANALIVAPTRELAQQVQKVFKEVSAGYNLITALVTGGLNIKTQEARLRQNPRVVIGTPGRLGDMLKRGALDLTKTHIVVWDEMDRMLDIGFIHQIELIEKNLPAKKQSLMFSATYPERVLKLAAQFLKNPSRVAADPENKVASKIEEKIIKTTRDAKLPTVINLLRTKGGSTLIFTRTREGAAFVARALAKEKFNVSLLHGGLSQGKRNAALKAFREEKTDVLVATDVAARGLDITHIQIVVNYDLPLNPEEYVHRAGRTARADKEGLAVSIITPQDRALWHEIENFLKRSGRNGNG